MPNHDQSADAAGFPSLRGTGNALVILACAVLVLFATRELSSFVAPTLFALNLFIVAYPVQRWLVARGAPKVVGVLACSVVVVLILLVFLFALLWALAAFVHELPAYQDRFQVLFDQLTGVLSRLGVSRSSVVEAWRDQVSPSRIAALATTALGMVRSAVTPLAMTVLIAFVILVDSVSYPARARQLGAVRPHLARSLGQFSHAVRQYWIVSSVFGLGTATADVVALWFLDVPLALVWGILSFLTNFIPNIGFLIGLVPPALMALLAKDPTTAIWVVVVYIVANFLIESLVQPKFQGDAVGVTATVSTLSLFLWSYALGALGALLALPTTLLVKAIFIDADPRRRWLNIFIAAGANHDVEADVET